MDITINKADGVLTIGFDRPEKKNAITAAMYQAMADALRDGEADAEVRAIMFVGRPDIFTAGNDLEDFLKQPPQGGNSPVAQFMERLSHATKPVIAAVAGAAIGIGTTMLLHCDLVYASEDAKFAMPFSQLGLCPEFASSLTVQRVAGYHRAAEKLLLGEVFKVDEAFQMGLVNKVLPPAELLGHARAQALKLVALPAASVRATKQLMKGDQVAQNDAKMVEEMRLFSAMLKAPEAREAFSAFLEKRKPDFRQFA